MRVTHRRVRGPAVAPLLVLDPGMWLNMVCVKPPYLADLENERMKKFILRKVFSEMYASIVTYDATVYFGGTFGYYCK